MRLKNQTLNWIIVVILFFGCSVISFCNEKSINDFTTYLADHDIIMTQNINNNKLYEGHDFQSKAGYQVTVDSTGEINSFTTNLSILQGEQLNYGKIIGLRWFTDHYLEKNTEFLEEVSKRTQNITSHQSFILDLGEWKLSVFAFPTNEQKVDLSLNFKDDASKDNTSSSQNVLASLTSIYKDLGCIERDNINTKRDEISYKLPYYKLDLKENIYYNAYVNKNKVIYKIQFIYYKNGFEFDFNDIPQLKQIIVLTAHNKNYPFEKLNVQFQHLKQQIQSEKNKDNMAGSSWKIKGSKTVMHIERYPNRNQCRVKITVSLVKK